MTGHDGNGDGGSDALWSLPEPVPPAAAVDPDTLAVLHRVIDRLRPRLPELARTFAEGAAARGRELFGLHFDQIQTLADDDLQAFDAFVIEVAAGITDGPLVEGLRRSARLGSRQGTPVEALVLGYNLGAQWFWNRVLEEATPTERPVLQGMTQQIRAIVQDIVLEVTKVSFAERQAHHPEEVRHEEIAVVDLLAGRGDPASRWCPVVLRPLPPSGITVLEQARSAVRVAAPGAVGAGHQGSMLVLVPTEGWSVPDLQARLHQAIENVKLMGGIGNPSPRAGVRDACTLAGELASLAMRTGRAPGAYGLGTLLVDYMLDRVPELRGHLGGLVADLPSELRTTLERWLVLRDRRAVAAELHVHPNTVGHRLRRSAELTGIDPTSTEGALTLHAALAARSLRPAR